VRSTGNISNLTWHVTGWQYIAKTDTNARIDLAGSSYSTGDQWDKVSQDLSVPSRGDETNQPITCDFALEWDGDGTLYFDDFSLKQGN
jgi:hypothetical protein